LPMFQFMLPHRFVNSASLSAFAQHEWNLSGLGIGAAGVQLIVRYFHKHNYMHALNLSNNSIDDEAVPWLCALLESSTVITSLNLAGNQISQDGLARIALSSIKSPLTKLDMSSHISGKKNTLGTKGAAAVAEMIREHHILQELNLAGVGGYGIYNIATEGITPAQGFTQLTVLDVSSNRMSERSFVALCKALLGTRLRELNLSRNPIGRDSGKALFELIANLKTLQVLNLSACELSTVASPSGPNVDFFLKLAGSFGSHLRVLQRRSSHPLFRCAGEIAFGNPYSRPQSRFALDALIMPIMIAIDP